MHLRYTGANAKFATQYKTETYSVNWDYQRKILIGQS